MTTLTTLTTEQIEAYKVEYKEILQKSYKAFDQAEFESTYEAVKTFYLEDKMDYDNRYSAFFHNEARLKGKLSLAKHEAFQPYTICYLAGVLKHKFITIHESLSGFNNLIDFYKAMNDFLEENKADYILCTDSKVNVRYRGTEDNPLRYIPVTATKEKQKADLKDLKKLTLDLYRDYINLTNEDTDKRFSSLESYIEEQEAKKQAAKLAEIQDTLMAEQKDMLAQAEQEFLLTDEYDFDIYSLADVIDDVNSKRLDNVFKMQQLVKALTNSVVEGDIPFLDTNNDKLVSDTLKAQGFEKKKTNTGSVWYVVDVEESEDTEEA